MLEARHLSVSYGAHRALDDVSVHVERGEICVILGANGAGKTTLLNAIAGLAAPQDGGRVTIGDRDITRMPANRVVEAGVALVPEGRGIFGDLTVRENLQLGAYGKQARSHREQQYKMVIGLFPRLSERSNQIVRTMSGGEQQMVAIGRALMSNPQILMLDEPSLGLSPLLCAELFRSLSDIGQTGTGILLVEQNAKLSLSIADRAYLIENGHIVGEGKAEALANDPAVQKAYLGGRAATHRRFIDVHASHHAQPAKAATSISADDLVRRATEIQRAYIEARRTGEQGVLGDVLARAGKSDQQSTPPPSASSHANRISLAAGDLAKRATRILADHIAARRPDPAPELKALPPPPAESKDNLVVLSGTSWSKTPTGA